MLCRVHVPRAEGLAPIMVSRKQGVYTELLSNIHIIILEAAAQEVEVTFGSY